MYATSREMLQKASAGGYAVGAFNVENAEMAWAVLEAAKELNAPVIVQTTSGTLKYFGSEYFAGMVQRAADLAPVPVALHLDHGSSFDVAKTCFAAGYSSIMIDGSALPFEENVALSAKVAAMCAEKGVPVEAELGIVGGKEDDTVAQASKYTDPAQAAEFAARTGVASLAVAVGTAHGFYKTAPVLNLPLVAELHKAVPVPIVLHGASGLADDVVREAVSLGMAKVNFATELRAAYTAAVRAYLGQNPDAYDPKKFGEAARLAVKELVKHKITVCGSAGRA